MAYLIAIDDCTNATYTALVNISEERQLVEECLKLVTVEEKTAVEETFFQLVILVNKSELLRGKKMIGFFSDGSPNMIGKNYHIAAKY